MFSRPIMTLKRMSQYLPRLLLTDSGSKMAAGLPRPTLRARYTNAIWLHRITTTAQQQSTTQQTENVFKQLQDHQVPHETKIQSLQAIVTNVQSHLASVPNPQDGVAGQCRINNNLGGILGWNVEGCHNVCKGQCGSRGRCY